MPVATEREVARKRDFLDAVEAGAGSLFSKGAAGEALRSSLDKIHRLVRTSQLESRGVKDAYRRLRDEAAVEEFDRAIAAMGLVRKQKGGRG